MKTKLVYNVFYERNGVIEKHNIFDHAGFMEDMRDIRNEYVEAYNELLMSGNIVGLGFIDDAAIDAFNENYKQTVFKEKLTRVLKYYFWAHSEYEVILTDWPTMITKDIAEKAMEEFKERDCYRVSVDLPVSIKVDVYDQIKLNFELFLNYIWENLDRF